LNDLAAGSPDTTSNHPLKCAYRVTQPGEIDLFAADFLQVSVFHRWPNALDTMLKTVDACRTSHKRYVIHPVEYFLAEIRPERRKIMMDDLRLMARNADLALIVHDESTRGKKRLVDEEADAYREGLGELSRFCVVSIENSGANKDIKLFWREYATSITLDIGHLEVAGIDSIRFVKTLEPDLVEKVDFVHMHRVNGVRGGIRDHWGLTEDCRELKALKELLLRKKNLQVILEIIEAEDVEKSLDLLQSLA